MKSPSGSGKIITFYSYKGGTGRSMALANIAWILASNNKRVLVIDWDLEAPGLQRYFRPFLVDKELTSSEGIVDLITEFILEAISPLEEGEVLAKDWYVPLAKTEPYVISLDWKFPPGGKIDFIPAGRQGADYALRLSAINWQRFYDVLGGGAFLEEVKKQMRPLYDYILIDSRTGVSDTSGICTVQMPDTLVVCFTFNNQSIIGASSVTQDVYEQRTRVIWEKESPKKDGGFSKSPYDFQIVPAPMRVDYGERDKLELRQRFARWKFDSFINQILPGDRNAFWRAVEVPYQTWFSYEEVLAPFRDDPDDPKSCLAAFVRLTGHITANDVNGFPSLLAPNRKQEILQEFASTPMPLAEESPALAAESLMDKQMRLAETTFRSFDEDQQLEAEHLWTRLVRVPRLGENVDNSKVRVALTDLKEEARPIIKTLVESELLTLGTDPKTRQPTVEVSNAELLRSWPRLLNWIERDRAFLLWRQELQTSKARWEEKQRASTELLRGHALTDIATWHPAFREYLNDSEIAFIEASIREEAARTSEESARHRRRILIRTAAIVVTLVAAIASVAYYLIRPNRLETSHSIAVQAQRAIDKFDTENKEGDQFQLGVLLATEAERVASSSETKALLQSTLSRLPRINSVSPQKENVLQVSITPNGSQILAVTGRLRSPQTISDDRQAKLQTLGGETLGLVSFESFPKVTGIFQLSPDGKYLAIASNQGRSCSVGVHDMSAGNKQVAKIDHKGQIDRIIFSPNSRYIATASQDGTVKVLDLLNIEQTNTPAAVLTHKGTVHAVTFSADSQFIATTGEDFFVRVRPTANMQAAVEDANLGRTAFIISLSPHGEYLATVSLDNTIVRVWQVASRELISTLPHEFVVRAVIFSSDGKIIAAGGSEGNITVWNNPQEPEKLRFTGAVDRLIVSPDGKYLAAIGNSNTARLWSYNDGHYEEAAYLIQSSGFNDLAFNWDSNRIVTAGADNTIRVWDLGVPLSQDLEQNESCSRLTRNLTTEEWKVYLADHLGAYRRTCPDIHQPLN